MIESRLIGALPAFNAFFLVGKYLLGLASQILEGRQLERRTNQWKDLA